MKFNGAFKVNCFADFFFFLRMTDWLRKIELDFLEETRPQKLAHRKERKKSRKYKTWFARKPIDDTNACPTRPRFQRFIFFSFLSSI